MIFFVLHSQNLFKQNTLYKYQVCIAGIIYQKEW